MMTTDMNTRDYKCAQSFREQICDSMYFELLLLGYFFEEIKSQRKKQKELSKQTNKWHFERTSAIV